MITILPTPRYATGFSKPISCHFHITRCISAGRLRLVELEDVFLVTIPVRCGSTRGLRLRDIGLGRVVGMARGASRCGFGRTTSSMGIQSRLSALQRSRGLLFGRFPRFELSKSDGGRNNVFEELKIVNSRNRLSCDPLASYHMSRGSCHTNVSVGYGLSVFLL